MIQFVSFSTTWIITLDIIRQKFTTYHLPRKKEKIIHFTWKNVMIMREEGKSKCTSLEGLIKVIIWSETNYHYCTHTSRVLNKLTSSINHVINHNCYLSPYITNQIHHLQDEIHPITKPIRCFNLELLRYDLSSVLREQHWSVVTPQRS